MNRKLSLGSLSTLGILCSLLVLNGCALLFGNVKPVDEKSETYGSEDLSKTSKDWVKLTASQEGADAKDSDAGDTEVPDVAFQNKVTASIISINSACRKGEAEQGNALKKDTDLLFLGIGNVTLREEKETKL